jgi:GrpB-like predicted nucleotidyltransferase (UPF0157 family)
MATSTYEYIPIILEQHNPQWAVEFEKVKKGLEQILAGIPIITIEHVGSTSIPDLKAKPVLDIDIETNRENLDAVTSALEAAGYTPIRDCRLPGRYSFFQPGSNAYDVFLPWWKLPPGTPPRGERRRNTYVCITGCLSLRNHRDLKRVLMEDEGLRREYEAEKEWLARHSNGDVKDYCKEKSTIVKKILRKAGWAEEDLDVVSKTCGRTELGREEQ